MERRQRIRSAASEDGRRAGEGSRLEGSGLETQEKRPFTCTRLDFRKVNLTLFPLRKLNLPTSCQFRNSLVRTTEAAGTIGTQQLAFADNLPGDGEFTLKTHVVRFARRKQRWPSGPSTANCPEVA